MQGTGLPCSMRPHPLIEEILGVYRARLGKDYDRYRNHAHRVYLACRLLDADPARERQYAIAAAFHDIGIWTASTFDYLPPSVRESRSYLLERGLGALADEVEAMIIWHHKVSRYQTVRWPSVEIFRRADWIDVSLQLKTFGIPKPALAALVKAYPLLGFHGFLVRRALRHFLRHPLHPLPMFRR